MGSVGISLLLVLGSPAAPPEGIPLAVRLLKGEELHYKGEIVESSDRVDNRYRKTESLEVRFFTLQVLEDATIGALLTIRQMNDDAAISKTAMVKPGSQLSLPVVRFDLVRIDHRNRCEWIEPREKLPPFDFSKATRKRIELPSLEFTADWELGFLVPLSGEMKLQWLEKSEEVWNGRKCLVLSVGEESTKETKKLAARILYSRTDGYACVVDRELKGAHNDWKLTTKYELQPTNRAIGTRFLETKHEIEMAWAFQAEMTATLQKPGKIDLAEFRNRSAKIQRYLDDTPSTTSFRPAIESLKRRCDSIVAGVIPYSPRSADAVKGSPWKLGDFAPDFVTLEVGANAKNYFRLEAARKKPVVLVFYKPKSATSQEALTVSEALYRKYAEKATVVALAIGDATAEDASEQRKELKYTLPIFYGHEAQKKYGVETFPQFFLIDSAGKLRWNFDAGVGPEVGYLVKEQLEKVLAEK